MFAEDFCRRRLSNVVNRRQRKIKRTKVVFQRSLVYRRFSPTHLGECVRTEARQLSQRFQSIGLPTIRLCFRLFLSRLQTLPTRTERNTPRLRVNFLRLLGIV